MTGGGVGSYEGEEMTSPPPLVLLRLEIQLTWPSPRLQHKAQAKAVGLSSRVLGQSEQRGAHPDYNRGLAPKMGLLH